MQGCELTVNNLCKDWQIILNGKQILFNLFTVLSIKMINLRTSRSKYRLFWAFLGKYRPFFDDFFQVGPYTDFLRKYGPLYKHWQWSCPALLRSCNSPQLHFNSDPHNMMKQTIYGQMPGSTGGQCKSLPQHERILSVFPLINCLKKSSRIQTEIKESL